jgi:hypothetical protein
MRRGERVRKMAAYRKVRALFLFALQLPFQPPYRLLCLVDPTPLGL